MNDLKDLHGVLKDLERHAPDAATVLGRLSDELDGSARHRLTRFAVPLAAAATVVAVASVSLVVATTRHHGASRRPGSASVAPAAPNHRPASKATSGHAPTDLNWSFDVGPVPGYDISLLEISSTAQYADITAHGQPKSAGEIDVFARGALNTGELTGRSPASVHGRAGFFAMFHSKPTLAWQYGDNAWALVTGDWGYQPDSATYDLPVARAAEQSVADAVDTSHPAPFLVDFTLGWLPAGLVTEQGVDVFGIDNSPLIEIGFGDGKPGAPGKPTYGGSAMTISRQAAGQDNPPNMTVDGKPAYYDSQVGLVVHFPDHTNLSIEVDPQHRDTFSKADLIKIAQNASFAPKLADRATWVPASQAIPR